MKKFNTLVLPFIIAIIAIIPPVNLRYIPEPTLWPYLVVGAAFFGIYILFSKAPTIIKIIPVLGLVNCFLSSAPFLSFSAYVSLVVCCYFYLGLSKISDWDPMFRVLITIFLLNGLFMVAQLASIDSLLNFGLDKTVNFGVVGQHMQMASFMVILSAVLIQRHPWFLLLTAAICLICNSSWGFLCVVVGGLLCLSQQQIQKKHLFTLAQVFLGLFVALAALTNKLSANLFSEASRLNVWKRTIEITMMKPLSGWGLGTYKAIFPGLCKINSVPWLTAHNDWLQFMFELGIPLFLVFLAAVGFMFWGLMVRFEKTKNIRMLAGFAMISLNMVAHFPARVLNCVPLMILFLVLCEQNIRGKVATSTE